MMDVVDAATCLRWESVCEVRTAHCATCEGHESPTDNRRVPRVPGHSVAVTRIAALDGGSNNGIQMSRLKPGTYRVYSGWDVTWITVEG